MYSQNDPIRWQALYIILHCNLDNKNLDLDFLEIMLIVMRRLAYRLHPSPCQRLFEPPESGRFQADIYNQHKRETVSVLPIQFEHETKSVSFFAAC